MKRLLVFIYAFFASIGMFATGQDGDRILIDGEMWVLLGKPLHADSLLHSSLMNILPKDRTITTANWDGYTGYWSIHDDRLVLDSITVSFWDDDARKYWQERLPASDMRQVFSRYYDNNDITATWLTDTIRIGKGEQIFYMHAGFMRNHEYEQLLAINRGKVTGRKSYHNRVVVDGFSFSMLKSQKRSGQSSPWISSHIQNWRDQKESYSIYATCNSTPLATSLTVMSVPSYQDTIVTRSHLWKA